LKDDVPVASWQLPALPRIHTDFVVSFYVSSFHCRDSLSTCSIPGLMEVNLPNKLTVQSQMRRVVFSKQSNTYQEWRFRAGVHNTSGGLSMQASVNPLPEEMFRMTWRSSKKP